jgi:hypothetical protein
LTPVLEEDNKPCDPAPLGISEPPVAAGVGSTHPGAMMPELEMKKVVSGGPARAIVFPTPMPACRIQSR